MNRCRIKKRYISAYLDGELDAQQANKVKEHLSSCRDCAQVAETYQHTYNLLQQPELHAGDYFLPRLKAQLDSHRAFQMSLKKRFSQLAFSFALISGLLVGIGLGVQLQQMHMPQSSAEGATAGDSYIDTSVFETMPPNSLTETYVRLSSHNE